MECAFCNKIADEVDLFEGVYNGKIVKICSPCAELEEIPLIRKPTQNQLIAADHRFSVRERMEQLSDPRKVKAISKEQEVANKNLAKLKIPPKPQKSNELLPNYNWKIQIARRRKKFSLNQLSKQTGLSLELLEQVEKGQLPENFKSIMAILQEVLDIKLFKDQPQKIIFNIPEKSPEKKEQEILEQTEQKIHETEESAKQKKKVIKQISSGEFDFSKREKLKDVTLKDLIEMKRQRDQKQAFEKEKEQHKEMFGDDVEL